MAADATLSDVRSTDPTLYGDAGLQVYDGDVSIGTVVKSGSGQIVDQGTSYDTIVNRGGEQDLLFGRSFDTIVNGGNITTDRYVGGAYIGDPILNGGSITAVSSEIFNPIIAGGGDLFGRDNSYVSNPVIINGSVGANGVSGVIDFAGHGNVSIGDYYRFGVQPPYTDNFKIGLSVKDFSADDTINLQQFAYLGPESTTVTLNGSDLNITSKSGAATIALTDSRTSSFRVSSDGGGGTLISAVDTRDRIAGPTGGYGTISGLAGDDVITAYNIKNTIFADGGDDTINAGKGEAKVDVANGDVTVNLGGYSNDVVGGNGNNIVSGSQGNSSVTLGSGSNYVNLGGHLNNVVLGNGDNIVGTGQGNATIHLGNGNNRVNVAGYTNTVLSGNGNNSVVGGDSLSKITLGNGDNRVITSGLYNSIKVGSGSNRIVAGSGSDTVSAGAGADVITLSGKNNTVVLNGTTATVDGGLGSDHVSAVGGNDTFVFRGSNDHLSLREYMTATIEDLASGLRVDVASSTQSDTITGFDQDHSAVVDLLGGAGGFHSVGEVMGALQSDQNGGTILSLGHGGTIDFAGTAITSLHAANFKIG